MEKKFNVVSLVRGVFLSIMIFSVILGFKVHALAQEFPTQPITIVCGSAAGGITDLAARTLANEAKKFLGGEILNTAKPGAMHTVAMSYVISRPADGYTLGTSTDAPFTRAPHTMKLSFNPLTDVTPIIAYGNFYDLLVARGDSPFKTFKDAIDFAKANPGKLTYGDLGATSISRINMAGLALQMGLNISMVPYGGDAPIILDILGGHIMIGGVGISSIVEHVKAGKLKVIAVAEGEERWEKFPEAPTYYELGFKDVTPPPNLCIWGPKGMPDPVVRKLEDAFKKASETPAFKKFALENEVSPMKKGQQAITGQELRNFLVKTFNVYGNLFQKLGMSK